MSAVINFAGLSQDGYVSAIKTSPLTVGKFKRIFVPTGRAYSLANVSIGDLPAISIKSIGGGSNLIATQMWSVRQRLQIEIITREWEDGVADNLYYYVRAAIKQDYEFSGPPGYSFRVLESTDYTTEQGTLKVPGSDRADNAGPPVTILRWEELCECGRWNPTLATN